MDELTSKQTLNKRFENISWGAFLMLIGGLWLVPDRWIPQGTWLIGAGLIMLALNLARYRNDIRMSGFTLFLGAIAVFSGIASLLRVDLPLFPILLILIGANILLRPIFEKNLTGEKEFSNE